MGKIADLTGVQKTLIDTLPKEAKLQRVISKRTDCLQRDVPKHIHWKVTGREKCGSRMNINNRDDHSFERIVKQSWFKNLEELHKGWTEAGVSASRAVTHRHMPRKCATTVAFLVSSDSRSRDKHQRRVTQSKGKKVWTAVQWSKVSFSD